jgi:hypothetical protein
MILDMHIVPSRRKEEYITMNIETRAISYHQVDSLGGLVPKGVRTNYDSTKKEV